MTAIEQQPEGVTADVTIGNNVHGLLWGRRVQQRDLAAHLGLTSSVLSKKLRGTSAWSAAQVLATAEFLDIEPGRLFQLSLPKVSPKLEVVTGGGRTSSPRSPLLLSVPTGLVSD